MKHNILPEFQNFLISRQLVPEKNVHFMPFGLVNFYHF
jgi:hypothetical protein